VHLEGAIRFETNELGELTRVSGPVADGGVINITRMPFIRKFYKVERK
jgi:hypothetical protein